MDIKECAAVAVERKERGGYNCCQAVLSALAEEAGISDGAAKALGAGFCAGMGTMEATCGALLGAGMIAGLKTGGAGTLRYTRGMLAEFKARCGATACGDLKAITNGAPLCPCSECVRNAVLAYGAAVYGEQ